MSSVEAKKVKINQLLDQAEDCSKKFDDVSSELNIHLDPSVIVSDHIKQLKKYNEVKDTALKLMELIANLRQMTIDEIAQEMKVDIND